MADPSSNNSPPTTHNEVEALRREISDLASHVGEVHAYLLGLAGLREQLARLQAGVDSLVRSDHLPLEALGYPERLIARRARLHAQNGEDGMTLAILAEAGSSTARFLEIGCGYNGGNSGVLAFELGWSGVMVDADPAAVAECRLRFNPERVAIVEALVTRDNVNALVRDHGLEGEIDVLSIDIDGNDYWVWEALDAVRPRLAIVEYNALFGPDRAVVVPYNPEFRYESKADYYGASLAALYRLANHKGFRLVAVEPRGANAFFLRDDLAPHIPAADPERVYRPVMQQGWEYCQPLRHGLPESLLDRTHVLYRRIEKERLRLVELD